MNRMRRAPLGRRLGGALAAIALALATGGGRCGPTAGAGEPAPADRTLDRVAALGRIEPHHGVRRVAGPPRPAVVIRELKVEEGDRVEKGQVLATLAGIGVERAEVARLTAELDNAERELKRHRELQSKRVSSESELRAFELARDVARANLERAQAELELSTVRAPMDGQVLKVHARDGERVGPDGIVELGATSEMYAVAEVYETDIGRVRVGQPAVVRSPALPKELTGTVERVGLEIGKKDVLSTDPVADADARVVEVEIRLAEPQLAAALTHLRVEVWIGP
jgi:RND family efflux transporter MFP subunit